VYPDPDPLVRGMDPAPDPSIIKQKYEEKPDLFIFEKLYKSASKSNKQKL
jgi:hypothetical protein